MKLEIWMDWLDCGTRVREIDAEERLLTGQFGIRRVLRDNKIEMLCSDGQPRIDPPSEYG